MNTVHSQAIRDKCGHCQARCRSAFGDLEPHELSQIDRIRTMVHFDRGDALPLSFENEHGFYCIRKGQVTLGLTIGKQIRPIRICGSGDLVGYSTECQSNMVIQASVGGTACFFSNVSFTDLQKKSPSISQGLAHMLSIIVLQKARRIYGLENFSVKNRVAAALLSLVERFGTPSQFGSKIDIKLDRRTLALFSATGLETLARTLTELENDRISVRDGRTIHILNQGQLGKLTFN